MFCCWPNEAVVHAYDFSLPGEQDEVSRTRQTMLRCTSSAKSVYLMAMVRVVEHTGEDGGAMWWKGRRLHETWLN